MEYYVQRHASGMVGNSMQWWKKGGSGYVCDIRQAQVWTEDESAKLCLEDRGVKYTRWRKDLIDGIVQHHVDYQEADLLDRNTPAQPEEETKPQEEPETPEEPQETPAEKLAKLCNSCLKNPPSPMHKCPFSVAMGQRDKPCDCCPECMAECEEDIDPDD